MNKFFYYFYILSLLFLVYLFGFISFKYDLFPKSWLNGSINLFIKDLGESKRTILLNGIKSISENKNSDEFQYTIKRNYNSNTISWKEAFYNLNDSISKNEFVKKREGFFISHNAQRISLMQDVLKDLKCKVAHLYIGIDITNPSLGNHVDKVDVWFWQNKGTTIWDFDNGDNYTVYEGDLIYIPKGTYHKVSSVEARFGISMSK